MSSEIPTPSGAGAATTGEHSLDKETKNKVYYEVETSTGRKVIVVYRVHEVYVHIPPELSAAGFELKIAGTVTITDQVRLNSLEYGGRAYFVYSSVMMGFYWGYGCIRVLQATVPGTGGDFHDYTVDR